MILVALLFGALGVTDLARTRFGTARTLWVPAALAIVVFILASLGTGQPWWWSPIAATAIIAWLLCTREPGTREPGTLERAGHRAGYWAIGGLAVVVAAAFVWGAALPTPSGPLVDWYLALPYEALHDIGFLTFALTVGLALFLIESANVVVRLALRGERSAVAAPSDSAAAGRSDLTGSSATSARPSVRWWRRRAASRATDDALEPAPPAPFTELRGGRFIGPLERLFVLALVLSGQFTALAAVIAAKGIVRFPEISKDTTGGSKAEYFLVGSFASWALVMLAALLIGLGATIK